MNRRSPWRVLPVLLPLKLLSTGAWAAKARPVPDPAEKVNPAKPPAARKTEGILEPPAPFVLQTSLDDFYVSCERNAYTGNPQIMAATYSLLHQNIQDAFNEAGVEIMSPHYSQIRDGNRMAIPDASLPPGYTPPPFRVERVPGDPRKDG